MQRIARSNAKYVTREFPHVSHKGRPDTKTFFYW